MKNSLKVAKLLCSLLSENNGAADHETKNSSGQQVDLLILCYSSFLTAFIKMVEKLWVREEAARGGREQFPSVT